MAFKVEFLRAAQREYRAVLEYLIEEAKNPQAATAFANELDHQVALISDNPEMYSPSQLSILAERGLRLCLVNTYATLYTMRGDTVFIVHIFHQSQDYARLV